MLILQTLKPWTLEKVGNPKTWDERATQLVVELLSHRTQPASVWANILSVVELLMPNASIVKELPGIRFVRYCRTILAHVSHTTDTCSTAQKLRRVLNDHIKRVAEEEGFPAKRIKVFTADCWQHLHNV
jgi:hypothetical protein